MKFSESGPDKYIQLDFELLRIELRELELLVTQLKESLNSSSPMFDSLYTGTHNMSLIVNHLESYDKSNLEVIRIEFGKLQKKLEESQKNQEGTNPDIGSCNHKGIASVGKPVISQLNVNLNLGGDRGFESMYWYGAYSSASVHNFLLYSDYQNLVLINFKQHNLPNGQGTGNNYIVHGNTLYYKNSPFSMAKLNLTTSKYDYRVIKKASATFSYSYSANQNMNDENGLCVTYATDESKGKTVIAKVNEVEFGIEELNINVYKALVGNAFMVCGVLYATRPVDVHTEEIFYSYDTKTEQEYYLGIPFEKFQDEYINTLNPIDQKLYMYNKGYYVSYSVTFSKN
ncbi:LOW QUALITY PROTEIN: olfactomedin-4 [Salvelinus alpinus]